jgi:hypothetical protein
MPTAFYQHALVRSYGFVRYCRNLAIFFVSRRAPVWWCQSYPPSHWGLWKVPSKWWVVL